MKEIVSKDKYMTSNNKSNMKKKMINTNDTIKFIFHSFNGLNLSSVGLKLDFYFEKFSDVGRTNNSEYCRFLQSF